MKMGNVMNCVEAGLSVTPSPIPVGKHISVRGYIFLNSADIKQIISDLCWQIGKFVDDVSPF